MTRLSNRDLTGAQRVGLLGEWGRIIACGAIGAVLVYLVFFFQAEPAPVDQGSPRSYEESSPVPELDPELMIMAKDTERDDRLVTEPEPLEHLLEKSLLVTPAIAQKLGMPDEPIPIATVRNRPDQFRGRYLWYKGKLEYLSPPRPGHPVRGYDYYEGRLRTADGEPVLFAVSVPPKAQVQVGAWARIEGYFLKLRDAHFPVRLDRAPMLIGPEVLPAYEDWAPVEQLDPEVLARVQDGIWNPESGRFEHAPDIELMLADSQSLPLWHVAAHAMFDAHREDANWQSVPYFNTREQFDAMRTGGMARGTKLRLVGTFVKGRRLPAAVNPAGIAAWTEVWIQVRELGGKTLPVWIPGRIADSWQRNRPVRVNAFYFKRYQYETLEGQVRWTPLFVAAGLDEFELAAQPMSSEVTALFAIAVLGVVAFLLWYARRERRQRQAYEAERTERQRRRRLAADQPCAS